MGGPLSIVGCAGAVVSLSLRRGCVSLPLWLVSLIDQLVGARTDERGTTPNTTCRCTMLFVFTRSWGAYVAGEQANVVHKVLGPPRGHQWHAVHPRGVPVAAGASSASTATIHTTSSLPMPMLPPRHSTATQCAVSHSHNTTRTTRSHRNRRERQESPGVNERAKNNQTRKEKKKWRKSCTRSWRS